MREAEKFGAVARVLAEVAPTLPVGEVLARAEEIVRVFRRDRTVKVTRARRTVMTPVTGTAQPSISIFDKPEALS